MLKVAFPTDAPGGLEARLSAHFGHCDAFTVVTIDDDGNTDVTVLENQGHAHGGCMAPVMFLKEAGAQALVAGGMGMRPLAGFQSVGIDVFFNEGAETVTAALELLQNGKARRFGAAQTCGGGGGCH